MTTSENQQRDISLDILKTMAIFMVIMIHITASGFVVFGPQWPAAMTLDSISRISVPIFFMITGATLLNRKHTIKSVAKKLNIVAIPLIAWSAIYIVFDSYYLGVHTDNWLTAILRGPVRHLWYLYALLGAYFFLPLTSTFYRHSSEREKLWMILGWFLGSSVMPLYKDLTGALLIGIDMSYIPIYSGYMILGAYIYDRVKIIRNSGQARRHLIATLLLSILSTITTIYLTYEKSISDQHYTIIFFNYYSTNVVISAASTFAAITIIFKDKLVGIISKPITYIGRTTFGVYTSHMIILAFTPKIVDPFGPMSQWLWYLLVTSLTLLISLVIVAGIQKVPYLRRICP